MQLCHYGVATARLASSPSSAWLLAEESHPLFPSPVRIDIAKGEVSLDSYALLR